MIPTRKTDEKFYRLFSTFHAFSEHLTKREDNELRDKYDHNAFCYSGQPTDDELRAALAYQKARGDAFLKLEGYEPLANAFGMECEETVTMVLPKGTDISGWKANPEVSIRTPDFDQLEHALFRRYAVELAVGLYHPTFAQTGRHPALSASKRNVPLCHFRQLFR